MGNNIAPELLERLRRSPQQQVALIITVDSDPVCYQNAIQALGLRVKRAFALTHRLAVEGAAQDFLALSRESWVLKMEEDRPVQAVG